MTLTDPRARIEAIHKLVKNGKLNSHEVLKACFGGQLPPELDIVNPPNFEIECRGAFSDPTFYIGSAVDTIRSNWLMLGATALFSSWRALGSLCALLFTATLVSVKGYVYPNRESHQLHLNEFWSALSYLNIGRKDHANTKIHEFYHGIQKYDGAISLSSTKNENRLKIKRFLPKSLSSVMQYLGSEAELGARMFTIITSSYVQYGFVPLTKYELWGCLVSQGLTPPEGVLRRADKDPACRRAFAKFPKAAEYLEQHGDNSAASDLNTFGKDVEGSKYFHIWDKIFPRIYGDMLENIGDRLGSIRTGHTHNIQLREIFMKYANSHAKLSAKRLLTPEERVAFQVVLRDTTEKMTLDDTKDLMFRIAKGEPYKELNPTRIRIPAGNTRLTTFMALSQHPEMRMGDITTTLYEATGLRFGPWQDAMMMAHAQLQAKIALKGKRPLAKAAQKIKSMRPLKRIWGPA